MQSSTAESTFRTYDPQPGGRGPDLTITIFPDADFANLPGVKDSDTKAVATPQGGDAADPTILTGASIVIRASAVIVAEENEARGNKRETLVEGILSHEVPGHARDITADPQGFQQRSQQDRTLKYEEQRNEISADRATKRVGMERVMRGEIHVSGLRRDVRFGKKLHP